MRQWTVQDVMTRDVASVSPDASYREVVDLLTDRGISAVPVVDAGGQVLGVVSEADLLHKVEAVGAQERRRIIRPSRRAMEKAHAATAGDLMTAPAVTVGPDATVSAAARRLESERVKRMPVVGEAGRLLGIVSRRDLLHMHTRPDRDIRADVVEQVLRHTLWVDPGGGDGRRRPGHGDAARAARQSQPGPPGRGADRRGARCGVRRQRPDLGVRRQ